MPAEPPPIAFDNSYARLPARFFARVAPTPVAAPGLVRLNLDLAARLGLDPASLDAGMLAGNRVPAGAEPIAQAYAGHQFGHFSPALGDGRAILLGEIVAPDGARYDLQLKGAGPTPFSRRGDGRAALGPVLREYLMGEAMHVLGIPTTRALAAATTGETVWRDRALPGAILARVAASHVRVGSFEFFAARGDLDAVRRLADHAIARHDPGLAGDYPGFLRAVAERQARLVAAWLLAGFIHGVMNTDNMAVSGETIDYGPCAFMDEYDPTTAFSAIDHAGRYAYGRQPRIAAWNLERLADALSPLLGDGSDAARETERAIGAFAATFEAAYLRGLRAKIGLDAERPGDDALAEALLRRMRETGADWTATFRALAEAADADADDTGSGGGAVPFGPLAGDGDPAWADWLGAWRRRLDAEPAPIAARAAAMRARNPVYIPRNHLVEAALDAATSGDFTPFETLLAVLAEPCRRRPGLEAFALPPRPEQRIVATHCGT